MKQLFLLSLLCLAVVFTTQAQDDIPTTSRALILGGSFGLSIQNNSENPASISTSFVNGMIVREARDWKSTNFSLNPYLGSQVSDNWIVGGRGTFAIQNLKFDQFGFFDPITGQLLVQAQEQNITTYGIGVFGRYTINPQKKLNFFLQNGFDYLVSREKIESEGIEIAEEKVTSFQLSVTPGVYWQLGDRFALLANIGILSYRNGKWEDKMFDVEQDFSAFTANFNLSTFRFGIEFRL